MTDKEIDERLGALMRDEAAAPDPAFVDRVLLAARIESRILEARRRSWRRALIDCGAAVAVGGTFFLLSQAQAPLPDGMLSLQGPAMAGLIMLALWGLVSAPTSVRVGGRRAMA